LLGETVDTNSIMVSQMLGNIGLDVHYKTIVGDNETRITEVLDHALKRVDFVITSGGLGPTVDDVTRQAVAAATEQKLVYRKDLERQIAARFRRFGRTMGENNKRQAWIPEKAIPIENPVGTAPCFIVETDEGTIICLPGVPRELEYLMQNVIIPYLQQKMGGAQIIKSKTLRTCGAGESDIDRQIDDLMRLDNPTVGLSAHLGWVDIRITAKAETDLEARSLMAPIEAEIRKRLDNIIFGVGQETLPGVVGQLLQKHDLSLALVDTLTAGGPVSLLEEDGYGYAIASKQLFASPAEALKQLSITSEDVEAAARQTAQKLSEPKVLGVSIVGPVNTSAAKKATLVAIAHQDEVKLRQYQSAYAGKTGQQWLTIQVLSLIWRWLRDL
jgi:competence/damage-inducible protein CinA-like protein